MKQYKVFKHPAGTSEAVKQGWSWPAFFFSFIWAMVKKQWALGIGVFIGAIVFGFIVGIAGGSDAIINIFSIILNITGLTHQCLYFEQPHTFEQILLIQTAEPALVGHA